MSWQYSNDCVYTYINARYTKEVTNFSGWQVIDRTWPHIGDIRVESDTVPEMACTKKFDTIQELSIYVKDNLVEEYKSATNWSAYASKIKPISSYVENFKPIISSHKCYLETDIMLSDYYDIKIEIKYATGKVYNPIVFGCGDKPGSPNYIGICSDGSWNVKIRYGERYYTSYFNSTQKWNEVVMTSSSVVINGSENVYTNQFGAFEKLGGNYPLTLFGHTTSEGSSISNSQAIEYLRVYSAGTLKHKLVPWYGGGLGKSGLKDEVTGKIYTKSEYVKANCLYYMQYNDVI